jgi:hypothetical protein
MRNVLPTLPLRPLRRLSALVGLGLIAAAGAQAQSSPYYIGVAQTFTHESNLLRLREGQIAPPDRSESDTISSTALVAGIDQSFGRQRLTGSAALRANRYADNKQFDSSGYGLNLGLDWETIESLSGRVSFGADRNQRADLRDRLGRFIEGGNAEDTERFSASARLGVAGPLSIEAGVSYSKLSYEAAAASYAEYSQSGGSLGLRYRLGGATSVALSARTSRVEYPNLLINQADPRDKRKTDNIDLNVLWVPSGSSRLDLTLSQGRTRHDQITERDFDGATGALAWTWNPGGRLRGNARLARDTGQNSDLATTAFSQTTDTLRVAADYDVTGKIVASASAQYYRRQLDGAGQFVTSVRGSDNGQVLTLGLRWTPLRSLTVGCQGSYEKRGSNSNVLLNDVYSANIVSCFGQFTLQ